jgi:hypothetical protein
LLLQVIIKVNYTNNIKEFPEYVGRLFGRNGKPRLILL